MMKCKSMFFVAYLTFEVHFKFFSNSFLELYSYEGFSSSDIRKNEAESFASIVGMKL